MVVHLLLKGCMPISIKEFKYYRVFTKGLQAASVIGRLCNSGVSLLGFSQYDCGGRASQLDLAPLDPAVLRRAAAAMGLELGESKSGFLIQGDNRPGTIAGILDQLANANLSFAGFQVAPSGAGRFSLIAWVEAGNPAPFAKTLAEREHADELVDEASAESFPASDAPAWCCTPA